MKIKHPTIPDVTYDVPNAAIDAWEAQGWQPELVEGIVALGLVEDEGAAVEALDAALATPIKTRGKPKPPTETPPATA